MANIRFLGDFDSIQEVWAALPSGGMEGDYLTVNGTTLSWNKFIRQWQNSSSVIQTPTRESNTHQGDHNIENDFRVGGRATVIGNLIVFGKIFNDSIKNGKSAYELWLEQEGNAGKTKDDFWAYLTADKGWVKKPIESQSALPSPSSSETKDKIYIYPNSDNTKYYAVVSNGIDGWITLLENDGDISGLVSGLENVMFLTKTLYQKFADWEEITDDITEFEIAGSGKYATYHSVIGTIDSSEYYSYSRPIHLNKGEGVRVLTYGNGLCVIQESDALGNIVKRLVSSGSENTYQYYTFIAEADMYVVVSAYTSSTNYPYKVEKCDGLYDVDLKKIPMLDEKVTTLWLNNIDWGKDLANNTEVVSEYYLGKYMPSTNIRGYSFDNESSSALSYAYSSPIRILKGQAVKVRCYGNYLVPVMECDESGNVLAVISSYPTANVNKYVEHSFIADRDMYIKICGRKQDSNYPSHIYIAESLWSLDAIKELMASLYNGVSIRTSQTAWADIPTLFTSDEVSEGETLYYAISTSSSMWNIRFYKEDLTAQGGYSQITGTEIAMNPCEPNVTYYGKFVVPNGFALAKSSYGTVNIKISKAGTILADSIEQKILAKELDEVKFAMANSSSLPAYYKEYLDKKEAEIRNMQLDIQGEGDSFIFVTDTHWINNYKQSPAIIESLLKRGLTNKVVFGGDLMGLHSDVNKETLDETLEYIKTQIDFHRKFASTVLSCGGKFFNVRGNHDINGYPATKTTQQGDNTIEMWIAPENATKNILFDQIEESGRISNREGSNYVYDNDMKKIRYIFVGDAKENNNPQYSFPYASVDWFVERLADTPASYDIVVICHYGALRSTLTNFLPDMDNIIKAFNERGEVNVVRTINNETFTKSKNFEGATSKVIAYISGHTHKNLQSFSAGVTHICTACDATYSENPHMNEKPYSRGQGTRTEQLFDFIQIDKAANMIYCKRIGAGYDRYFHTQRNTVVNGNSTTLEATMLSGELTWGCYNNDKAVTKTNETEITSTRVSVSDGVVSGIDVGEAVVYAMDETGNREFFEVIVT